MPLDAMGDAMQDALDRAAIAAGTQPGSGTGGSSTPGSYSGYGGMGDGMGDSMGDGMQPVLLSSVTPTGGFTLSVLINYVPADPSLVGVTLLQAGVLYGPFQATVVPNADSSLSLQVALGTVPPGLVAGSVLVKTGQIVGGVFSQEVEGITETGNLEVPAPPLPSYLLSVAAWRARLRAIIRDQALALLPGEDALDPALATVFSDDDLSDVLRNTLPVLSVYRPVSKPLPPLTLVPTVGMYVLPGDFLEPVEETWPWLAPSAWERGDVPGQRYAMLQRQAYSSAAFPLGSALGQRTFGTVGYGYYGAYAALWGDGQPVGLDPTSLLTEGYGAFTGNCTQVTFLDASVDTGGPVLVLSPPPMQSGITSPRMAYKAAHTVRRLTVLSDNSGWTPNTLGGYVSSIVPLAADFVDASDVLSFSGDSDLVRLSLLYAGWWTLTQIVTSLGQSDGQKYAFFEQRSGLGRKDILSLAATLLTEFEKRTVNRPQGMRG